MPPESNTPGSQPPAPPAMPTLLDTERDMLARAWFYLRDTLQIDYPGLVQHMGYGGSRSDRVRFWEQWVALMELVTTGASIAQNRPLPLYVPAPYQGAPPNGFAARTPAFAAAPARHVAGQAAAPAANVPTNYGALPAGSAALPPVPSAPMVPVFARARPASVPNNVVAPPAVYAAPTPFVSGPTVPVSARAGPANVPANSVAPPTAFAARTPAFAAAPARYVAGPAAALAANVPANHGAPPAGSAAFPSAIYASTPGGAPTPAVYDGARTGIPDYLLVFAPRYVLDPSTSDPECIFAYVPSRPGLPPVPWTAPTRDAAAPIVSAEAAFAIATEFADPVTRGYAANAVESYAAPVTFTEVADDDGPAPAPAQAPVPAPVVSAPPVPTISVSGPSPSPAPAPAPTFLPAPAVANPGTTTPAKGLSAPPQPQAQAQAKQDKVDSAPQKRSADEISGSVAGGSGDGDHSENGSGSEVSAPTPGPAKKRTPLPGWGAPLPQHVQDRIDRGRRRQ